MFRLARVLVLILLVGTALFVSRASAATPSRASAPMPSPADSLGAILDRWTRAVGGTPEGSGVHLRGHGTTGGVSSTFESWITRGGVRTITTEGDERSEWVAAAGTVWWHDWNGRTHTLQGRDRADGLTDAFVRGLIAAGPSRSALASARATDRGRDSTGMLQIVRVTPPGGVACELFLDGKTGRPLSATRRPYYDPVTIEFHDWREVRGRFVPFLVVDVDREGHADTTWIDEAMPLAANEVVSFKRPADGPSDVRFASGDRALAIPFNFENDHIMIECRVNDSKPLWFMLDTGADYNVINATRVGELGLTSFGAATTSGGGGSTGLSYTRVDRLQIGGVTLLGQREGVLDVSGLEKLYGMPMGGVLGMDFIDRFTVSIDYDRHVMNLYTPGHDQDALRGTVVPFVLEEGHPHVRGGIVVDDAGEIATDFVIDSGAAESANLTTPFVRAHRLLERARRTPAPAPNVTPGAEKQFYTQTAVRGHCRVIRIGEIRVTEVPVNLQQGTAGAYSSPSFSGTIGERILSRFNTTYDYAHSRIYFEPNTANAKPFTPRRTYGLSLVADGADFTHFSVAGVRKDSPADSAGFAKGDVIASFDGKPASSWRLADLRAALANEGTRHRLEVERAGGGTVPFDVTVRLVSIEDR
jgi:hypothetical protein